MAVGQGVIAKGLKQLIEEFGEKGLLQQASRVEGEAVRALDEIRPSTIRELLTRKMERPGAIEKAPSPEEMDLFAKAVDRGSDVAPEYRETESKALQLKEQLPAAEAIEPDEVIEPLRTKLLKAPETPAIEVSEGAPSKSPLALPPGPSESSEQLVGKPTSLREEAEQAAVSKNGKFGKLATGAGLTGLFSYAPSEVSTIGSREEKPKTLAEAIPQASKETQGIGPFADADKYASALAAAPKKEVPSPAKQVQKITQEKQKEDEVGKADDTKEAIDTLTARINRATETRDEDRRRADIGRLAEMIGKGLVQMGAAAQGMRTGVDLSNVVANLPSIDWNAQRKEITDDYKTEIAAIKDEQDTIRKKLERAEDMAQKERFHTDEMNLKKLIAKAQESYQDRMAGVNELNAQTAAGVGSAKEKSMLSKAGGEEAKDVKSQTEALNELYSAQEAGDEKAVRVALAKLPIDVQKRYSQAGGIIGTLTGNISKPEQIQQEVARLNQPAAAPAPATPGKQDSQIIAFANQYKLDYNKAKEILMKRGYTPKE